MPHIHAQIDLVVSCFIAREGKVLLVNHQKLDGWFPVGGHVELHQDTDEALDAEVNEEAGIPVQYLLPPAALPPFPDYLHISQSHNTKRLRTPWAVEIHDFPGFPGHRHLALVYFARGLAEEVQLSRAEHHDIRWFSPRDLEEPEVRPRILDTIYWYALNIIFMEAML